MPRGLAARDPVIAVLRHALFFQELPVRPSLALIRVILSGLVNNPFALGDLRVANIAVLHVLVEALVAFFLLHFQFFLPHPYYRLVP